MLRREFLKFSGLGVFAPLGIATAVPVWRLQPQPVAEAAPGGIILPRGVPVVFSGDRLRSIAMPVGGICAGQVMLSGDGRLVDWSVDGRPDATPTQLEQAIVVTTLSADGSRHRVVLATVDNGGSFRRAEFLGAYPCAEIRYLDPAVEGFGVDVALQAGGPFIPLNPEDSSLPCAIRRINITNPGTEPIKVAIGAVCANGIAIGHQGELRFINRIERGDGFTAVAMTLEDTAGVEPAHVGTMALALLGVGAASTADDPNVFDPLSLSQRGRETPEYSGRHRACGGVSITADIPPGETRSVTIINAWHFPDHAHGKGTNYATRFTDATDVVRYIAEHRERLLGETDEFMRAFYLESSLPWWLLQRVMSPTSVLATRTCEWWADGMFHGRDHAGGPGGNSLVAWASSEAEARLFPSLARSVRIMQDFGSAFDERTGAIAVRGGGIPGEGATLDTQARALMKFIREHQNGTGNEMLRATWPRIRKAVEWFLTQDAADSPTGESDGLVESSWPTRFGEDRPGTDAYQAGMVLAGLLAGQRCGRLVGDGEPSRRMLDAFILGRVWCEQQAHANGFFSYRTRDGERGPLADVCFAPHVLAPAMARQVDLSPVWLDPMVRESLATIARHNWTPGDVTVGEDDLATPGANSGVRLTSRPGDDDRAAPLESHETRRIDFEYELAAAMIAFGDERPELVTTGLAILAGLDARARSAGRNPFDESIAKEFEPGPMAAWGAYHAITGLTHDASNAGTIGNLSRVQDHDFRACFIASTAWGLYSQRRTARAQTSRWDVRWGVLNLLEVQARTPPGMGTQGPFDMLIRTRERRLAGSMIQDTSRTVVTLISPITLRTGDFIEVVWSW